MYVLISVGWSYPLMWESTCEKVLPSSPPENPEVFIKKTTLKQMFQVIKGQSLFQMILFSSQGESRWEWIARVGRKISVLKQRWVAAPPVADSPEGLVWSRQYINSSVNQANKKLIFSSFIDSKAISLQTKHFCYGQSFHTLHHRFWSLSTREVDKSKPWGSFIEGATLWNPLSLVFCPTLWNPLSLVLAQLFETHFHLSWAQLWGAKFSVDFPQLESVVFQSENKTTGDGGIA